RCGRAAAGVEHAELVDHLGVRVDERDGDDAADLGVGITAKACAASAQETHPAPGEVSIARIAFGGKGFRRAHIGECKRGWRVLAADAPAADDAAERAADHPAERCADAAAACVVIL